VLRRNISGLGVEENSMEESIPRAIEIPPPEAVQPEAVLSLGWEPSRVSVTVNPPEAARRRRADWHGLAGEVVQFTGAEPFEYEFDGPVHLLTAVERAVRVDGETRVDGMPVSRRHDFGRTMSFIPRGHRLRGRFVPRVLPLTGYFYIDPAMLAADPELHFAEIDFEPILFFEDPALWGTTRKLMGLIESPGPVPRLYAETLGAVLAVELVRASMGVGAVVPADRGGLAAWQQRIACDYIETNLDRDISLSFLAALVRLSPTHFCRAFRRSLGMPPHRYHIHRRLERAKALLADRERSITVIAMDSGFGASSSFATAFRKATGVTPLQYRRSLF
jgi:AraC family transcriptional regulator